MAIPLLAYTTMTKTSHGLPLVLLKKKLQVHWKAVIRIEKLSRDELVQRQNMRKCSIGCSLTLELSKTRHSCGTQPQFNLVINETILTLF